MTGPFDAVIARARAAADQTGTAAAPSGTERQRLERLASEFESMLLNQMLREMRKAGQWQEDDGEESDGFGAAALFETLDTELSKVLSQAQGLGLKQELMAAFDRLDGGGARRDGAGLGADGDAAELVDLTGGRDVTSAFGMRRDPFTGETRFHRGVDLRAAYGEDVATAVGGTVASSGAQGAYGTTVVVEHADGTRSRFAHLSLALVQAGDTVEPGQLIGRAGSSGRATAPHLHLEVTDRDGRYLDPRNHLDTDR